ncbi:MAG: archease [Actinomycetota bacterium]|nr:archease [Actinomycetota bacterium]
MYRWGEHTGELELEIEAAREEDVFRDALAALAELLDEDGGGEVQTYDVDVASRDRPALLADWLTELVFLAETEEFVPAAVTALELAGSRLRATVSGRRGHPRHLVKAVTYHGLRFATVNDRWRAHVVLDV